MFRIYECRQAAGFLSFRYTVEGKGISKIGEIIDLGVELNIIEKSGSWFSYKGNKLGQGRDTVKGLLEDNPELSEELEGAIRAKIEGKDVEEAPDF